jgi:hypothetical protein
VSDNTARGRTTLKRRAKACGPGTRCWCQVGEGLAVAQPGAWTVNSPATVARRIRRRGEYAIRRKTIAWGMPDVSGASAVNTRAHTYYPQRARGCGCIGNPAFPAPSIFRRAKVSGKISGATRRDDEKACLEMRWTMPHTQPSSSGLTGRSSIPEMSVMESIGRDVLDAPHARSMTAVCGGAFLAKPQARGLQVFHDPIIKTAC